MSSQSRSHRVYRFLLVLLPRTFRRQFGEDIAALFRDRLDEAGDSTQRRLGVWIQSIADLLQHGTAERLRELRVSRNFVNSQTRRRTPMTSLYQDAKIAVRSFAKSPGFLAVSVLTLALGIGASTTIFSIVDSVLLQPLPFEEPDRLVMVRGRWPVRNVEKAGLSPGDLADFIRDTTAFEDFAALTIGTTPLTLEDAETEQRRVASVTPNFFSVLGIQPVLGRGFELSDSEDTVLISHGLWQGQFGGDPSVLGATLRLRGNAHTIVGVLARRLVIHVPERIGAPIIDTDVWRIRNWDLDPSSANRRNYALRVFARLAPGATLERAQQEADWVASEHRRLYDDAARVNTQFDVFTMHSQVVDTVEPILLGFGVAIGFILLIACANVANLLLARAKTREAELAVRAALGAGRGRLLRQLLVESLVLAALAGLVGSALAYGALQLVLLLDPADFPRLEKVDIDGTTLGFSLLLSLATVLLFGLMPAVQSTRASITDALHQGGRGAIGKRKRLGATLIATEVALSLVLLVGAGLLARSFVSLTRVSPGFQTDGTLTFRANLPPEKSTELEQRISELPGVIAVARGNRAPLAGPAARGPFVPDTIAVDDTRGYPASLFAFVTPGYFDAMGIALLRGRVFEQADLSSNGDGTFSRWAVVDERAAASIWPGSDPIGRHVRRVRGSNVDGPSRIVGVVESIRQEGLRDEGPGTIYFLVPSVSSFVVRSNTEPEALIEPIRAELNTVAPESPMYQVRTMQSYVEESLASARLVMVLAGVFAIVALLLAAVGLYGVVSYAVRQRMHEMGIRIVLGAERSTISTLVVGEGVRLALVGVAFGVAASLFLTRLLSGWLYGVTPSDALTYVSITSLLVGVAALACYLPARRAAAAEPSAVLRE